MAKLGTVNFYPADHGGWIVEVVDEDWRGKWYWNRVGIFGSKSEAAKLARKLSN